jgi:hypothetical protein
MLIPKESGWQPFVDSLDKFSDDYLQSPNQPQLQKRGSL